VATEKAEFFEGARAAVPIILGYLPLGFALGVLAYQVGLHPLEVGIMSLLVFAGSGQFIAVGLLSGGAGPLEIIMTTFLVNLRHLLMGAALSPHLERFRRWLLWVIGFEITDETFAVAIGHYQDHEAAEAFHLGLNISAHLGWIAGTVMGAIFGNLIPHPELWGLNFALPAMFIALLVGQLQNMATAVVAVLAAALSLLFYTYLPGNWNIILASILAAGTGTVVSIWTTKSS